MGRWRNASKRERADEEVGHPSYGESVAWASRIHLEPAMALLTISMSKIGLTDDDMERWCNWIGDHLRTSIPRFSSCQFGLVDFAENRLTAAGVCRLLETFTQLKLPVQVLKLHHNRIAEGSCFARYLKGGGLLHELHLSHNDLDAQASALIIEAAVLAGDSSGKAYPRKVGKGNSAPLWVRLEQNYIDPAAFARILDAKFDSKICCDARSKWCTPHSCVQQGAATAVHVKNLPQQRRRGSSSSAMGSAIVRRPDGSETAQILRFDWEKGSWVKDTIDIPAKSGDPAALSEGLKVLIGAGMGRSAAQRSTESQTLSQEVGQTLGADLLRSLRKDGEDEEAWAMRIEAPEFRPGARFYWSTPAAPSDAHLLSAETSAGAASDDTESLEVPATAGEPDPNEPGSLFNGSPQAKCVQSHWQDENLSSPAAWLSKAPSLEELPDTMLWKKDEGKAESAKESASVASPVSLERDQDEVTCRISGDDTHNKLHDTSPEAEARSEARSGDRGPSDESSEPEEKGLLKDNSPQAKHVQILKSMPLRPSEGNREELTAECTTAATVAKSEEPRRPFANKVTKRPSTVPKRCPSKSEEPNKENEKKTPRPFPQRAQVHQVFNMFDEREAEAASHVDASPHVLEVWKLKPEEPEETLPQGEPLPQGQ